MSLSNRTNTFLKSKWNRYTLLSIVLIFVGKALYPQLSGIQFSSLKISWYFVLLSVVFETIARCFTGFGYDRLLRYYNRPLPLMSSISIAWVSFLGKYLPGKFFLVAIAMYFLKKFKIPIHIAGLIPLLNTLMTVCAALILSTPLFFLFHDKLVSSTGFWIVSLICALLLFKPDIFSFIWKRLIKKKEIVDSITQLNTRQTLTCLGLALLQCLCFGISTWFITRAITPVSMSMILWLISITTFSNTVGLFAFFSPGGIGVKDGICFFALGNIVGPENAALITVLLRIVYTLMDLGTAFIGFIYLSYLGKE